MDFTYDAYQMLLNLLQRCHYEFCSYHNWQQQNRCVILRHDIDYSVEHSLELARLEASMGIQSTYYVLLTSDFYNVASQKNLRMLHEMQRMGHEIGLHFDEKCYPVTTLADTIERIVREKNILSQVLDTRIRCVSMHRPSKITLEADLQIPEMINSYGKTFFNDFKYLSDSRRRWREPVLDIIRSGTYNRLHILTHAFWYQTSEESLQATVKNFLLSAVPQRYDQLMDNITDLNDIIQKDEVIGV